MTTHFQCPICNGDQFSPYIQTKDYSVSRETFDILECQVCQFLVTTPLPSDLSKYYQSPGYISHSRKASTLIDKVYYAARGYTRSWKERLVRKFSHQAASKLLDYGCGTGEFLKYARSKNWTIQGVEPSDTARTIAQENTKANVATTLAQIIDPNFDVITLWHVLEHVPDLNITIDLLKKRLAENGTIFIAVPNYKAKDAKHYANFWAAYDVPRHLWHFSQKTMHHLIKNHELKLKATLPMPLDAYYVSLLSEKYKSGGNQSPLHMLNATVNAFRSNADAQTTGEYSSLIYVVKK